MKKSFKSFNSANIIRVSVRHNYDEDLHRKNHFAEIDIINEAGTEWDLEILSSETKSYSHYDRPDILTIRIDGDTERETLIEALQFIVNELKANDSKF